MLLAAVMSSLLADRAGVPTLLLFLVAVYMSDRTFMYTNDGVSTIHSALVFLKRGALSFSPVTEPW